MKNKGFTLIELLGTIVVLAIIALITIPIISGVVNKARLNSLKNSAYGLIDASNLYYAQYGISNNIRFDIDNNKVLSNDVEEDKMLSYRGSIKEGTVIINTKGKTTVCVTDGKNSAYKNYNESSVTLVSNKRCSVPENTNIVYLDNEATLTELSNQELTDRLIALENKMSNMYPVGSIYISVNDTDPSTLYGGTWEKIEDRFLLASSSTYALGSTGGEATHTLTVDEMPAHSHSVTVTGGNHAHALQSIRTTADGSYGLAHNGAYSQNVLWWYGAGLSTNYSGNLTMTGTAAAVGNGVAHNNMPPYLVVNVWKRTA